MNVVSQSTPMLEWHNNSHLISQQKKMIVIKPYLNDKCIWHKDFFIENCLQFGLKRYSDETQGLYTFQKGINAQIVQDNWHDKLQWQNVL